MEELLERLRARFDLVIIDTPPLSEVSDALALVPYVAGVLIVSRLGHTTYDSAGQLRKQLALSGHGAFGVVANYAPVERSSYYYDHATAVEGT
jgi:Mrp family chromosome partitioning ATPase